MDVGHDSMSFTFEIMAYPTNSQNAIKFAKQNEIVKAPKVPIQKGYTIFGQIIDIKQGEKR